MGCDFAEGMLARARAKAPAGGSGPRAAAIRVGRRAGAALRGRPLRRGDRGLRRAQLRGPAARPLRDGARRASRRACGRARAHDPHAGSAVAVLPALVRPPRARPRRPGGRAASASRLMRLAAPRTAIADAYTYLPNSVKRFPAPEALAAEMRARGSVRDRLPAAWPGASSRSTPAPSPRRGHDEHGVAEHSRRQLPRGAWMGSTRSCGAAGRACASGWPAPSCTSSASPPQAGAPLASHANATIIAGGKRLRPLLVLLAAESAGGPPATARARSASCARPWRSSSCTRRRSCTTI